MDNSSKKTILVVEDDKFLRELLTRKLESEGFPVSMAVEGKEALRKIKEELPHLVLLDLVLPGIDGFGILEQMKKDPQTDKIPVIILSNLGQREEVERGLELGADDYLIKAHFTPNDIIERVKKFLG